MKLCYLRTLSILLTFSVLVAKLGAEPLISSWYTEKTGSYARIFESTATENSLSSVTTWSRGQGVQTLPVYAGVHEISVSDDWVYIHTSGLGFHVMGPWYLNEAKTQDFPSYPANTASIYRLPRTPTDFDGTQTTPAGAIGYYVDGVALFDATDTFSYINASGADASPAGGAGGRGDGVWNRDAWINEGVTFDSAFAHQAGASHHYHANAVAVRSQLGDSVDYDEANNTYTERFDGEHSPILGWCADGHPIYGPYGFSDPNDASSQVELMRSGYQKRDGTNGSTNLSATGRTSLPQWANTLQGRNTALASNVYGPDVSEDFVLGHYLEDYAYRGDLGATLGIEFDLDRFNGRFCVTPEFPDGVWAYFTCIEADGTPKYPYTIGRNFYGTPAGGTVNAVGETVETIFYGGPNKQHVAKGVAVDAGTVTLTWDVVEGGTYQIETSTTPGGNWDDSTPEFTAAAIEEVASDSDSLGNLERNFYRIIRTGIAGYDTSGFSDVFGDGGGNTGGGGDGDLTVVPDSGAAGSTVNLTITITSENPPPPPNFVAANPVTVGPYTATNVVRNAGTGAITATVVIPADASGALDVSVTFPPGPMGEPQLTYTQPGGFTVD